MVQVFVIIWLGQPYVFDSYSKASSWLLEKVPYLTEIEIRMSIYSRELL